AAEPRSDAGGARPFRLDDRRDCDRPARFEVAGELPEEGVVAAHGPIIVAARRLRLSAMPSVRAPMRSIRVAVFPAAGLGTRFLPATKAQPKEMLPLVDRPLVQYVVEEARAAGIERIVIVTGRGKNAIEDHFDTSFELEHMLEERGKSELLGLVREISDMIPISYVRQKIALGLGHAVLQARELVGPEGFAVMLGDDIVDADEPCIGQMMKLYARRGNPVIALQEVPRVQTRQYGIVAGDRVQDRVVRITDMIEKPPPERAPSNLA